MSLMIKLWLPPSPFPSFFQTVRCPSFVVPSERSSEAANIPRCGHQESRFNTSIPLELQQQIHHLFHHLPLKMEQTSTVLLDDWPLDGPSPLLSNRFLYQTRLAVKEASPGASRMANESHGILCWKEPPRGDSKQGRVQWEGVNFWVKIQFLCQKKTT